MTAVTVTPVTVAVTPVTSVTVAMTPVRVLRPGSDRPSGYRLIPEYQPGRGHLAALVALVAQADAAITLRNLQTEAEQ